MLELRGDALAQAVGAGRQDERQGRRIDGGDGLAAARHQAAVLGDHQEQLLDHQRLGVRVGRHVVAEEHREVELAKRSEEHTSELQSLMRISYAVFCLKKKTQKQTTNS